MGCEGRLLAPTILEDGSGGGGEEPPTVSVYGSCRTQTTIVGGAWCGVAVCGTSTTPLSSSFYIWAHEPLPGCLRFAVWQVARLCVAGPQAGTHPPIDRKGAPAAARGAPARAPRV